MESTLKDVVEMKTCTWIVFDLISMSFFSYDKAMNKIDGK